LRHEDPRIVRVEDLSLLPVRLLDLDTNLLGEEASYAIEDVAIVERR
jgi:hypothetical protein